MQEKGKRKKRITRAEAVETLLGERRDDLKLLKNFSIHIIMARNGALLVGGDGAEVFRFDPDNLEGLQHFHYAIDDAVGSAGSRYSRECLRHVIVHGDKYICENAKCPICHGGEAQ